MPEPTDAEIRSRIYRGYLEQRRCEAEYARAEQVLGLLLALAVIAVIVGGLWRLRHQYRPAAVGPHVERQVSAMAPVLLDSLLRVGGDALPVYIDLASRELPEVWPQVERGLAREMADFPETAQRHLEASLHTALEESARRLRDRLEAEFPGLLEPEMLTRIENELTSMLEEEGQQAIEQFVIRYSDDLDTLVAALGDFVPNRFQLYDDDDALAAYYLHLWITLLDYELMDVR